MIIDTETFHSYIYLHLHSNIKIPEIRNLADFKTRSEQILTISLIINLKNRDFFFLNVHTLKQRYY